MTKNDLLEAIKDLSKEKQTQIINIGDLFEYFGIPVINKNQKKMIESGIYPLLDELADDLLIDDLSEGNLSWGRNKGACGTIGLSIGSWIKLN